MRWYHRAVVSVVCILIAISLTLVASGGYTPVNPDLSIFLTGVAVLLLLSAIAVWLYRNEPYTESEIPSSPGEWTDDGYRRLDSYENEDVSRNIQNITDSGYYMDRRYFGGFDPRVERPKKD